MDSHKEDDVHLKAWRKIALALFKREFHVITTRQRYLARTACETVCESLAKHRCGRRFADLTDKEKEHILRSVGGGRQQPFRIDQLWHSMNGENA